MVVRFVHEIGLTKPGRPFVGRTNPYGTGANKAPKPQLVPYADLRYTSTSSAASIIARQHHILSMFRGILSHESFLGHTAREIRDKELATLALKGYLVRKSTEFDPRNGRKNKVMDFVFAGWHFHEPQEHQKVEEKINEVIDELHAQGISASFIGFDYSPRELESLGFKAPTANQRVSPRLVLLHVRLDQKSHASLITDLQNAINHALSTET